MHLPFNMLFMQGKFVSLTAAEHIKTRLEKACSYGFGYSKYHETRFFFILLSMMIRVALVNTTIL